MRSVGSMIVGEVCWDVTDAQWMTAVGWLEGGWQRRVSGVPIDAGCTRGSMIVGNGRNTGHTVKKVNNEKYTCCHKNGKWLPRALESVSIASALSTALTIYPCQIQVHQRWQSTFQLPTARKEWRPATAGSSPPFGYLSTLRYTL